MLVCFFLLMAQRIQSPSSINYYKKCPRCYYYKYIMGLQLSPSIYMIRGKILHSVLEDFFKVDIFKINKDHHEFELKVVLQNLFKKKWDSAKLELEELKLKENKLDYFYDESLIMLDNWFGNFMKRLFSKTEKLSFKEAFQELIPEREVYFKSEEYQAHGFIDAIYEFNGKIYVIDYKTSRRDVVTKEYRLQLALYALFYYEKYGKKPDYVGIDFLNHRVRSIKVDDELIELAKNEARWIQEKTISEDIKDYSKSGNIYCDCHKYEEILTQRGLSEFI
jgi:CRISPR/Cas system-associated exonuclease Cas4 (RecB family)